MEPKKIDRPKEKELNLTDFADSITFWSQFKRDDQKGIKNAVIQQINKLIKDSGINEKYKVIFLVHDVLVHDEKNSINRYVLDRIYSTLVKIKKSESILLILNSGGGEVEPAYLISKCCKLYSQFHVAVPRKAKSAATLLSLGAHSIHMGDISELGPIDPQIKGLPALAIDDAIEAIANIVESYPKSADLFARYLSSNLGIQALGYYKRIPASALDYASRLLSDKTFENTSAENISKKLVRGYKDHGFVIDKDEAKSILEKMVQYDTEEYRLSDKIYRLLETFIIVSWAVHKKRYSLEYLGEVDEGFYLGEKE